MSMTTCTFIFDVIVTNIQSATVDIDDPKKLQVELRFNGTSIPITASRINVTEFKANAGCEVTVDPKNLRQNLDECGIPIIVTYTDYILGLGHFSFPKSIINEITETMSETVHAEVCALSLNKTKVGSIELLCRMAVRCVESTKPQESICSRYTDKSINPGDILLIVAQSQRLSRICDDPWLDSLEENESLKFGTHSFGKDNANADKPTPTFLHTPAADAACCEIKKMAQDCEKVVDSITECSGQLRPIKPPCRRPPELAGPCSALCKYPQENNKGNSANFPCFTQLKVLEGKSRYPINAPISDTRKKKIKETSFCPVCLTNMTWLPKLAACPTCGIKPIPIAKDSHTSKPKAESMLLDFMDSSNATCMNLSENPRKEKKVQKKEKECGCTCKGGKLCAFCRVRLMCSDFYAVNDKQVSEVKEDDPSDDYCEVNMKKSQTDSVPFLSRVFSELRDLHNLKDTVKSEDHKKQCDSKPTPKSRKKAGTCQTSERKFSIKERTILTQQRIKAANKRNRVIGQAHQDSHRNGLISRRHGWAWSSTKEAVKHGWQPGLIRRPIKKLMQFFLQGSGNSNVSCKQNQKAHGTQECHQPTLNLCKKDGAIFVTLRALDNPSMEMKPIVFKVVKSDLAKALSEIKREFKAKGYRKCCCHNPVMTCVCRSILEKKHLECALQKECKRRGIVNCVDHLVLTDTSDSEMEFDFDVCPPTGGATAKPLRKTINIETQTVAKDLNVPPKFPMKYTPYQRAIDCAAGGHYMGTAFGAPTENVFEDGVFGYRGGGPHGSIDAPHDRSRGGPMRLGGRGFTEGPPGGSSFPYGKKPKVPGSSAPIPVRMTKHYYKALADAANAEKQALADAAEKKRKGPDMLKYLIKAGTVPKPWDPNDKA